MNLLPRLHRANSCSNASYAGLITVFLAFIGVMPAVAGPPGTVSFAGFEAPVFYTSGLRPGWVVSADMDNDGDLDLIISSHPEHALFIHINDGNGVFTLGQAIPVGPSPNDIQPFDFTGDGLLDLIVTDGIIDQIQFYENLGNGTFQFSHQIQASALPTEIAAGDLDGDGDVDLVVNNVFGGSEQILLNDGANNFATSLFLFPGAGPADLKLIDMDNDGDLDILTANIFSNDFTILLNNGDGTFAKPWKTDVTGVPFGITPGDFDNDGDMDLILNNSVDFHVLRRIGPGLEFTEQIYPFFNNFSGALGLASDMNNDGALDWIHIRADAPIREIAVHFGDPDGMLTGFLNLAPESPDTGTIGQPELVTLLGSWGFNPFSGGADIDGDGVVNARDLAGMIANWGPGHGRVDFSFDFNQAIAGEPQRFTTADIDQDGDEDLIVIAITVDGGFLTVFRNQQNSPQPR